MLLGVLLFGRKLPDIGRSLGLPLLAERRLGWKANHKMRDVVREMLAGLPPPPHRN